jgi:hypothetical protein
MYIGNMRGSNTDLNFVWIHFVNKTFVPNIVESFRKIAKEETDNLRSNCKVLIVDGQWNVLANTSIGIYILDCF